MSLSNRLIAILVSPASRRGLCALAFLLPVAATNVAGAGEPKYGFRIANDTRSTLTFSIKIAASEEWEDVTLPAGRCYYRHGSREVLGEPVIAFDSSFREGIQQREYRLSTIPSPPGGTFNTLFGIRYFFCLSNDGAIDLEVRKPRNLPRFNTLGLAAAFSPSDDAFDEAYDDWYQESLQAYARLWRTRR